MNNIPILLHFLNLLIIIVQQAHPLYTNSKNIIELNPKNFNSLVIKSDEIWIVEFYALWCVYCQNFVPEYEKAANVLRGIVKVGAVNADTHRELPIRFEVNGLPSIKLFGPDKLNPKTLDEARNSEQLIEAALLATKEVVLKRLGVSDLFHDPMATSSDIVELTERNFEELVVNSKELWMVHFYTHWCGHCKALQPHLLTAAKELRSRVMFGKIDGSVNKNLAEKYDVIAYPNVKLFLEDKTKNPVDYNGGRRVSDIIDWLDKKINKVPDVVILEIIDESSLRDSCENEDYCLIAFLPNLLECPPTCRKVYLSMLQKVANIYRERKIGWVWSEANDQPFLQKSFKVGEKFPVLSAIDYKNKLYHVHDGDFSESDISDLVSDLLQKNINPKFVFELPEIHPALPWDEEEYLYKIEL